MLKIAIAPNAFRGSLTAFEAAHCISAGLSKSQLPCETILMPLADGGNGTLEVWQASHQAQMLTVEVSGPLGTPLKAQYALHDETALIEMAQASGIELIPTEKRNPLKTSSFGTGQLIKTAIEQKANHILVAVGGSASVDGGAGCLQALGARLLDNHGQPLQLGGGNLSQLAHIDITPIENLLSSVNIQILCDVDNPLLGERGAAPIFGPQKGANAEMVRQLEANLAHFSEIAQRDLGINIADTKYSGAAGGLSAGLMLIGATAISGIEAIIKECAYDLRLQAGDIDLLITGEGKLDDQTEGGKAPLGIAQEGAKHGIPTIVLAGSVKASPDMLESWGISAAWSIIPEPSSLEIALQNANQWLTLAATQLGNTLKTGLNFK